MSKGRLIVICGPTATGKTRLGIELARRLGGEIVSADSMQVYRGLDIGTAKATRAEREAVPHHMLDVAEPAENYSVARYVAEASRVCDALLAQGKTPVVVGGTGQYIDALAAGLDFAAAPGDEGLRARLGAEYETVGGEAFRERLRSVDPARAEKLSPGDKRRLVRALEVWELTGKTITAHDEETRQREAQYETKRVVLNYAERAALYARIDSRVDEMAAQGLFEEVERLLRAGVPADCTAMQAIGYKEAALALRGAISREEALGQIKLASRRYAKRQLTWFRRAEDALWIEWEGAPDFTLALERAENYARE